MAVEGWHIYQMLFRIGKESPLSLNKILVMGFIVCGIIVGVTFGVGEWSGESAYGNPAM
jgi:hypothetical protein